MSVALVGGGVASVSTLAVGATGWLVLAVAFGVTTVVLGGQSAYQAQA